MYMLQRRRTAFFLNFIATAVAEMAFVKMVKLREQSLPPVEIQKVNIFKDYLLFLNQK